MERIPVSSSNIASVGYEPGTSTLQVEFNDGSVYDYYDVPEDTYTALIGAGSVGSFFHSNIRNTFSFQQV
ncbi:KTSC domain-containing protein [Pseudomonas frederiksbergensis]|uniref:KTSC domain-containing protein n=1 Tax=Pseudomonas frederiksbergensis TaxID=104087 RepID=UPI000F49DE25|nr:KTSC domain-containing protein [Pseudomonas frederiksbergensis]